MVCNENAGQQLHYFNDTKKVWQYHSTDINKFFSSCWKHLLQIFTTVEGFFFTKSQRQVMWDHQNANFRILHHLQLRKRVWKAIPRQARATYGLSLSPILANFQKVPKIPVLFRSIRDGHNDRMYAQVQTSSSLKIKFKRYFPKLVSKLHVDFSYDSKLLN